MLGSVADGLLTRSDVPIVMLGPAGRQIDRIANLLVPVDGTPGGALALSSAVELAKVSSARIRLMEVVVPLMSAALNPSEYDPAWDDEALSAARTYVAGMLTRVRGSGVVADGDARMAPDIAASIVQAAVGTPAT